MRRKYKEAAEEMESPKVGSGVGVVSRRVLHKLKKVILGLESHLPTRPEPSLCQSPEKVSKQPSNPLCMPAFPSLSVSYLTFELVQSIFVR